MRPGRTLTNIAKGYYYYSINLAPGTGIEAPSASVEITGGKIDAGYFGLMANNATISGTAQITAGRAVLYARNNNSNSNAITGGTFKAPKLMEDEGCPGEQFPIPAGIFHGIHPTPSGLGLCRDVRR